MWHPRKSSGIARNIGRKGTDMILVASFVIAIVVGLAAYQVWSSL